MREVVLSEKNIKRIAAFILSVALICSAVIPSYGENGGQKNVRAATTYSGKFVITNESGRPVSGYAYEYIETIADYSGWNVEYVPYKSFDDAIKAVENGDAEIYFDVCNISEREGKMLFPDEPMGNEAYCLYCKTGDRGMYSEGFSCKNGKRIGITAGTVQEKLLKEWCAEKGFSPEIITFDSKLETRQALENGVVDLICEINLLDNDNIMVVEEIARKDYYLAISKKREDLLEDVNSACKTVAGYNPYFTDDLSRKYFGNNIVSKILSPGEEEWVSNHSVLTAGYLEDYLPISGVDEDGEVIGAISTVLPLMLEAININDRVEIQYKGFKTTSEMNEALINNEIDTAFPVFDTVFRGKNNGLCFTSEVLSCSTDLVYRDEYTNKTESVIAVNENNRMMEAYVDMYYPDSEKKYYESIEKCINAVKKGEAGSTIVNGYRNHELLSLSGDASLDTLNLKNNVDYSFAVRANNPALLLLLNRALENTDKSVFLKKTYEYAGSLVDYSLWDLIKAKKNIIAVYISIFVTALLFIVIAVLNKKAGTETLTRLNNRVAAGKYLRKKMNSGKDFGIVSLDIDKFKKVNDTYGHPEGDRALKYVSEAILKSVPSSYFVSRISGDEFMIIGGKSEEELANLEDLINSNLMEIYKMNGCEYNNEVSAGYMIKNNEIASLDELIEAVDEKLYNRKTEKAGR